MKICHIYSNAFQDLSNKNIENNFLMIFRSRVSWTFATESLGPSSFTAPRKKGKRL